MNNNIFLLIDGNNVLHKSFYAFNYLNYKTSFGIYTNAVYGFARKINSLLAQYKPKYIAIAFDKGKATFRHKMYDNYKANRSKTPDELAMQFAVVRELVKSYGIKYIEMSEFEADDIIGTLSKVKGVEKIIVSTDHDLMQLIDDDVKIHYSTNAQDGYTIYDKNKFLEEYKFLPQYLIDYKAICGDSSDNYKGVEGIGKVGAIKLLSQFQTIENIYNNLDQLSLKTLEKLTISKDSCYQSKKLATIKTDIDMDLNLDTYLTNINENTLNDFFLKYEMKSLLTIKQQKQETNKFHEVKTISNYLSPIIYLDHSEFEYINNKVYGLCFISENNYEYITIEDLKNDYKALEFLKSDNKKYFYDLKRCRYLLKQYDIEISFKSDDLYIMTFLDDNRNSSIEKLFRANRIDLDYLVKDVYGTQKKPIDNKELRLKYLNQISNGLLKLYKKIIQNLKDKNLLDLYLNIEHPLVEITYNMETCGITCDREVLKNISKNIKQQIEVIEKDVYDYVGESFNISSPKQLASILFNKLNLPNIKKDSTDVEVLEKLRSYSPIISSIIEYRKLFKILTTYANGFQEYILDDQKIHTKFFTCSTNTGRLSSSEPNLQNISIKTEEGRQIRQAFIASKDSILVSFDYSQIELRILAHLSNEKKLIDAFNNDIDIHSQTAMDILNLQKEEVTDIERRKAKAINFGVIYGISGHGLSNQTDLTVKQSKDYIEKYYQTYPNIKKYMQEQINFCKENGYTTTILKRRRYIDEINSTNFQTYQFGQRAAMNSTIQGSAADLIKLAMIKIDEIFKAKNFKSKLILQIHDELVFDVCLSEFDEVLKVIEDTMVNAMKLNVKLSVSKGYGHTLKDIK